MRFVDTCVPSPSAEWHFSKNMLVPPWLQWAFCPRTLHPTVTGMLCYPSGYNLVLCCMNDLVFCCTNSVQLWYGINVVLLVAGAHKKEKSQQKTHAKTAKNGPKVVTRAPKIDPGELLGAILGPRQLLTPKKPFGGPLFGPQGAPFWEPFRLMLPSRAVLKRKNDNFGGIWLQGHFLNRF